MPEREHNDLTMLGVVSVVDVIAHTREQHSSRAFQAGLGSNRAGRRLERHQFDRALKLLDECVRRGRSIRTPPCVSSLYLPSRTRRVNDLNRSRHQRASRRNNSAAGTTSPRSASAMRSASSSSSAEESTNDFSSTSITTVTLAPSGNSTSPSVTIAPSRTVAENTRISITIAPFALRANGEDELPSRGAVS